jgi:hypothetical protein
MLVDHIHLIYTPVAAYTGHTTVQVSAVVKVGVVRQLVYLHPLNGLAALYRVAYWLQLGTIDFDLPLTLAVTVGTCLISWHIREARALSKTVAESTIQTKLPSMNLMGKRYRLRGLITDPCISGCGVVSHAKRDAYCNKDQGNGYLER